MKFDVYKYNESEYFPVEISDEEKIYVLENLVSQLDYIIDNYDKKLEKLQNNKKMVVPVLQNSSLLASIAFLAHTIYNKGEVKEAEVILNLVLICASKISNAIFSLKEEKLIKALEPLKLMLADIKGSLNELIQEEDVIEHAN